MQYLPSEIYFARAKVNGVVKRATLDTQTFSTAGARESAVLFGYTLYVG